MEPNNHINYIPASAVDLSPNSECKVFHLKEHSSLSAPIHENDTLNLKPWIIITKPLASKDDLAHIFSRIFDWTDLIWRRIGEKVSGCKLMRWDALTVAGDDFGETRSRVAHLFGRYTIALLPLESDSLVE
jgi:hypothetical protein